MSDAVVANSSDVDAVGTEDVLPVFSRISWGAILAGAVLALALYFLLTLLGVAIGLSVAGDAGAAELGTGAAVWSVLVTAVCLFAGGYAASHFTVGEHKMEAAVYGLVVWAVVFSMLLWLMASGVRAGFNAMVGVATAGGAAVGAAADAVPSDALSSLSAADLEAAARKAGLEQSQIDRLTASAADAPADAPADARRAAESGELRRDAEAVASDVAAATTWAAWLAFAGTLISMLAAMAGGYVGAGPRFRLYPMPGRTVR